MLFCISCHASVDLLSSTSLNNPLLDQGFAYQQLGKAIQGTDTPGGTFQGNVKFNATEGAQFAKYITLCEHSTRQVSLRKTSNRFKGRMEEDTQRILEVRVSGRESALLDSAGPFTLSRRERTLFWRFLAKRALLIFHNAASLRLATLVLTAVIALQKELEVIIFLNQLSYIHLF